MNAADQQAIRATLSLMASIMAAKSFVNEKDVLTNYGLPDHLIDWVLSHCSTCGDTGTFDRKVKRITARETWVDIVPTPCPGVVHDPAHAGLGAS